MREWWLGRRAIQYIVGDFTGAVNHSADGWTIEIVSGKSQAGEGGYFLVEELRAAVVAEIVLRDGAGPDLDVGDYGGFGDVQNAAKFLVDDRLQILWRKLAGSGVKRAAYEAGEENGAFGSTAWKQRRVPNSAEDAQVGGARDEKTEAVERVGYGRAGVAE